MFIPPPLLTDQLTVCIPSLLPSLPPTLPLSLPSSLHPSVPPSLSTSLPTSLTHSQNALGPLPQTMVDFWRAVWQEKVDSIVMVTNVIEGNQVKCQRYWPQSGNENYGPFTITLTEQQMFADYIIRHLHVSVSAKYMYIRCLRSYNCYIVYI